MHITLCTLAPYRLPLRQPWISARGEFSMREGYLVRIVSDTGLAGYGDCAPLLQAGTESLENAAACLLAWTAKLSGMVVEDALTRIRTEIVGMPAASCGLETALLDLLAQHGGVPLARWFNPRSSTAVKVNAALGGLDPQVSERALAAVDEGYSVLKLKVGLASRQEEISLLQGLAGRLPVGVVLRLDANCSWSKTEAQDYIDALAGLPVESVEDPLANPDMAEWSRLQDKASFPLAADESLRLMGVDAVFNRFPVRRVVLKPMVLGGLGPALALAHRAREADVECVVTSTVDSSVGVTAALHLAAAVANDLAHGLATSVWLARDVGAGPLVAGGAIKLVGVPGLGCKLVVGDELFFS